MHKQMNNYEKDNRLTQERNEIKRVAKEIENDNNRKAMQQEMIKNEFLFYNDQQKLSNKKRKDLEVKHKQTETYTHFPFTAGDQVEEHKRELGKQLGEDMKSFMQMRSGNSSDTSSILPRRYKQAMTPGRLKPIYDSSYLPPFQNPTVIQDNDPIKSMNQMIALKRHQHDMEK